MKLRPPTPSSAAASAVMRGNRGKDTRPELQVRSALHRVGLRYRCALPIKTDSVRVRPDVVFTRARVALFIDGCFWHGCPEHGMTPRSNRSYWKAKLGRNLERDRRVNAALDAEGWTVVRAWEHEPVDAVVGRVRAAVADRR